MRLEQRERQQLAEALRRSCVSARRDELRRADNDRSALAAALAASRLEQLADLELEQALVVSQREHEREQRRHELSALEDELDKAAAIKASLLAQHDKLPDELIQLVVDFDQQKERAERKAELLYKDVRANGPGWAYALATRLPASWDRQ